jgi:RNA polymerase sigma-70 factor, ECF subfamily
VPDPDLARQREVVNAFFAAARDGDFGRLVAVLDPDVVLRTDAGASRPGLNMVTRGAEAVARRATMFARPSAAVRPVLVNGAAGVVATQDGRPVSVLAFTVAGGRIVEIDSVVDPERLSLLEL